jgi:uncharacterized protein YndB with AHSA1/START domain
LHLEDRIKKQVEIKAPVSKVWRALRDHHQFGKWFGVKLETGFVVGQIAWGYITFPGYENLKWEVTIQKMEPEKLFSFTWHPYAIDPKMDYSKEVPTLVEFNLEPTPNGTRLRLTESGFSQIPAGRRSEALRMNDGGWTAQMQNIQKYVTA